MLLNGQKFKIYVTDTYVTIVNRIAAKLSTLPKWLLFSPELTPTSNLLTGEFTVKDALKDILNAQSLSIPDSFQKPPKVKTKTVEKLFIAANSILENSENPRLFLMSMRNFSIDVSKTWSDRRSIVAKLKKKIEIVERSATEHESAATDFDTRPSIPYSEFELDHIQFTVRFGNVDKTLPELFNLIRLSKTVPYAAAYLGQSTMFKTFRDSEISESWPDLDASNLILVKVNGEIQTSKKRYTKTPFKKYTNAAFTVIENELICTMDMKIGFKYVSKPEFIRLATEIFHPLDLKPKASEENVAVAYFSFPNQCMDIDVFAELSMNDPTFYSLIVIDEFSRASKIKQNLYIHVISTSETCSVQTKYTTKHNMFGMEDIGEPFVRCRVQTRSVKDIERFQNVLGKLFNVYNLQRSKVIEQYRTFVPTFLAGSEKCGKRKKRSQPMGLREIAPEIFFPKYSRKCIYRPTIIDDVDAAKSKLQVMRFPIKGESVPRNYVCDISHHAFPGLRENVLENKDVFPFVPCCYSKDQSDKPDSLYRKYFFGEEVTGKVHHVQDVYTTNKILPSNVIGILPKRIREMFGILEKDPKFYFVRKGVHRSHMSSIEAILSGKNKLVNESDESVMRILRAERERLATDSFAMSAKQELFDESVEEIIRKIKTSDLRVTLYARILELAYDCNVFVFSSENEEDGELVVPRHAKAYYKFKPTRETFFLYQHMGSESDHAEYPQCELIVRSDVDNVKAQVTGFSPTDSIVRGVFDLFRKLSRSYIFGSPIPLIQIRKIPVASQLVDLYGKCRIVNVTHGSKMVTIVTDPIPPFAAVAATTVYRADLNTILDFVSVWKIEILWQRVSENRLKEIGVNLGIFGTILTDSPPDRLPNVPVKPDEEEYRSLNLLNFVAKFDEQKRTARLLHSWALYCASKFKFFSNKRGVMTDADYSEFARSNVVVSGLSYSYDVRSTKSQFDQPSKFTTSDGKLIVPSVEALKRLIFALRLFEKDHTKKFDDYRNNKSIPDFYEEIGDFETVSNQYVLNGKDAVLNLIDSYEAKYVITKTVKPESKYAYFFKTNLVDTKRVYLAQNALTVDAAKRIVERWNVDGFNVGSNVETNPSSDYDVKIFKYVNEREITRLTSGTQPGAILAYKIDGVAKYTALLPI